MRLIQEANPDWRLLSWAMAVCAVAISAAGVYLAVRVDSTGTIFNPWRIEERPANCAQCHREVTVHPDANARESISFDSVTTARAHFK